MFALIVFAVVARRLGSTAFAEYQLARGAIAILIPGLSVGLPVALTRYVARAHVASEREPAAYFSAAALILATVLAVLLPLAFVMRAFIGRLFFGHAGGSTLVLPLLVVVASYLLDALVYAYLRGINRGGLATGLRVINTGLAPFVFCFTVTSIGVLLYAMSAVIAASSLLVLTTLGLSWNHEAVSGHLRELWGFGIRRLGGDIAQPVLLASPAAIAANVASVNAAGAVALGTSIVVLIASVFAPVGLALLPRASAAFGRGDHQIVVRATWEVLAVTILVSTVTSAAAIGTLPLLVKVYLGNSFNGSIALIRIVLLGAPGYAIYVGGRSILDAYYERAVNARNLILSLVVLGIVTIGFAGSAQREMAPAFGFLAGANCLAALTLRSLRIMVRSANGKVLGS